MSENRFVSGNVIVLYCNFVKLESKEHLPEHIMERIAVCTRIYELIMKSKPDKSDTIIKVAADMDVGNIVKNDLLNNGVDESMIAVESSYNNIGHLSSYQQKNIFDKATASYKGYKFQFEGAFDKRPIEDVEEDAKSEKLSKKFTNIKEKGKNKMVDMLLNYIFPESKKR
jgi:hypothetical protein